MLCGILSVVPGVPATGAPLETTTASLAGHRREHPLPRGTGWAFSVEEAKLPLPRNRGPRGRTGKREVSCLSSSLCVY